MDIPETERKEDFLVELKTPLFIEHIMAQFLDYCVKPLWPSRLVKILSSTAG